MFTAFFYRFRGFLAFAVGTTLLGGGCIFSSSPVRGLAIPSSQTLPYDSSTTAQPDVIVELFEPYFNASLGPGGQTLLAEAAPARVRERETGRVIEYRRSQGGYGSWSADRERQLNLFLLRSFFFHPGSFEDNAEVGIDSLYARARIHDPYTRYVDSVDAEEYRRESRTSVRPRVLGVQVRENDAADTIFLQLVAPGSPADQAGLRRGMPVLAVNDSVVTGDSAFARFVRFVESDTLQARLTVGTAQGPRTEALIRDTVTFPTVLTDSLGGAGYIAIFSFTQSTIAGGSTHTEFRKALDVTRRFPATVLDLRGNGGGSLSVTLRMCDELLAGGVIIRLIERNLQGGATLRSETVFRANRGDRGEGRAYVLLADHGSASASEIFIAALRENLGIPFVGEATYGKGVGQVAIDTDGKGVAVITYGQARTASGVNYNGVGLLPTHPSTARPDAMLAQAAGIAVPGNLARRAVTDRDGIDARRAALIEWNRRQALRPDVVEWGEGKSEIKNQK